MSFNIDSVLSEMADAMQASVKSDIGDISSYAESILKNEKDSLKELGLARLSGDVNESVFNSEVEREKKVVETELLTIEIMTTAAAQKAVNAAINVFVSAVMKAV